jgi:hypothetical protein
MRKLLVLGVLAVVPGLCAASEPPLPDYGPPVAETPAADVAREGPRPSAPHANPRLKLSYRRFSISGPDGNPITLDGGQLDVYPLSRRWLRLGLEAEGGRGASDTANVTARLWYGLAGLTLGVQYPARVTPFVEGRAAVGALGGSLSGTSVIGGTSVSAQGINAVTLLYLGGIDAGVEVYTVGRAYVTVALGWVHPVYYGLSAITLQATGSTQTTRVAADVFTFKIGIGF